MIVGGQTSARALTIIDYHQLSWTIMRRLTRALVSVKYQGPVSTSTLYNGLYGEAPPERGTFFTLQVYERVGISRVEVYERVGKSVI